MGKKRQPGLMGAPPSRPVPSRPRVASRLPRQASRRPRCSLLWTRGEERSGAERRAPACRCLLRAGASRAGPEGKRCSAGSLFPFPLAPRGRESVSKRLGCPQSAAGAAQPGDFVRPLSTPKEVMGERGSLPAALGRPGGASAICLEKWMPPSPRKEPGWDHQWQGGAGTWEEEEGTDPRPVSNLAHSAPPSRCSSESAKWLHREKEGSLQ